MIRALAFALAFVLTGCASASEETYRFSAWGKSITVSIVSGEKIRQIRVGAFGLPPNTIGCSYWSRGAQRQCFVMLTQRPPAWLVFHELLTRCRDGNTHNGSKSFYKGPTIVWAG